MTNIEAILKVLEDGNSWTIWDLRVEVMKLTGRMCSETGLSGQVRDCRKQGIDIPGHYLKDANGKPTKSYVYQLPKPGRSWCCERSW